MSAELIPCEAWWTVESGEDECRNAREGACESACTCGLLDSKHGCEEELPAEFRALMSPWEGRLGLVPVLVCASHASRSDLRIAP